MGHACRRCVRLALPLLFAFAGVLPRAAAGADAWVEPKFDPPAGSKWIIERELDVEKNNGGTMVGHTLKETALLTIESKNDSGFIVTYTRQSSSYDGDPAGAAEWRIAFQTLQGLALRIDTDANGKPLRIENWDAMKAALKSAAASEPINSANPEVIAKVHEYADRMLAVDDKKAAELYLDDLSVLAVAQNTGLRPGEIHKGTLPVANALSDAITKTVTVSLADADAKTGKARYLMTETYDPESMKALVSQTSRELSATTVSASLVDEAIKNAVVSGVTRAELTVEGGMTRELRSESASSFRVPGTISANTEDKLVTVKPAE
jgi:hypothetical protein